MPLALRAPPRSSSLALCGSLRLIHLLERLLRDVANDFPAALDFLDWHSLYLLYHSVYEPLGEAVTFLFPVLRVLPPGVFPLPIHILATLSR